MRRRIEIRIDQASLDLVEDYKASTRPVLTTAEALRRLIILGVSASKFVNEGSDSAVKFLDAQTVRQDTGGNVYLLDARMGRVQELAPAVLIAGYPRRWIQSNFTGQAFARALSLGSTHHFDERRALRRGGRQSPGGRSDLVDTPAHLHDRLSLRECAGQDSGRLLGRAGAIGVPTLRGCAIPVEQAP
jgi:hypothetical protein